MLNKNYPNPITPIRTVTEPKQILDLLVGHIRIRFDTVLRFTIELPKGRGEAQLIGFPEMLRINGVVVLDIKDCDGHEIYSETVGLDRIKMVEELGDIDVAYPADRFPIQHGLAHEINDALPYVSHNQLCAPSNHAMHTVAR